MSTPDKLSGQKNGALASFAACTTPAANKFFQAIAIQVGRLPGLGESHMPVARHAALAEYRRSAPAWAWRRPGPGRWPRGRPTAAGNRSGRACLHRSSRGSLPGRARWTGAGTRRCRTGRRWWRPVRTGRWVTSASDRPYLRPSLAMRDRAWRVGTNLRVVGGGIAMRFLADQQHGQAALAPHRKVEGQTRDHRDHHVQNFRRHGGKVDHPDRTAFAGHAEQPGQHVSSSCPAPRGCRT